MKNKSKEKTVIIVAIVFVLAGFLFMFRGSIFSGYLFKGFSFGKNDITKMPEADGTTAEISKNTTITQTFKCNVDSIDNIALVFSRLYYLNEIEKEEDIPFITIELKDGDEILMSDKFRVDCIEDQHRTFISSDKPISGLKDKELTIVVNNESNLDTGLVLMSKKDKKCSYTYNGMDVVGTLCFVVNSK